MDPAPLKDVIATSAIFTAARLTGVLLLVITKQGIDFVLRIYRPPNPNIFVIYQEQETLSTGCPANPFACPMVFYRL
jgi:hypothetical protein